MNRPTDEQNNTGRTAQDIDADSVDQSAAQVAERSADSDAEIDPETAFDILRNGRRRSTLSHLLDTDGSSIALGELAERVAAAENGVPQSELSSAQRKRVYVSLYQSHLPKMDDAGVVIFDQDRGVVSAGPTATAVERYLSTDADAAGHRRCYAVLSLAGLSVLGIGFVAGWLPGAAFGVGVLLAMGTCAAFGTVR